MNEWIDCWQCGGAGDLEGECTCWDDTCCCLEPKAPTCNVCNGKGGWMRQEPVEPFYIRQSREDRTPAEIRDWFSKCAEEAKAEGAQFCRFSHHPDDAQLLLVECWKEKVVTDQGPIRWSLDKDLT